MRKKLSYFRKYQFLKSAFIIVVFQFLYAFHFKKKLNSFIGIVVEFFNFCNVILNYCFQGGAS